ncbi:MAG: hypothetical protein OK442_01795 [Thaumarchaeota archaeon]|nr:hypothetical protein [Nitrososphaerota archaeon]
MKGSDKWGQGGGPKVRVEFVLAVLVAATLVGAYFYIEGNRLSSGVRVGTVTTISTTGVQCDDSSMPQAAQAVEQDPTFTGLSEGLCYNYLGESQATMTFASYNGTIAYPCGDAPLQSPASEILVNVTGSQSLLSARLLNSSQVGYEQQACGASVPVDVASVTDVESTIPAVPQLNVTLSLPTGGTSVASLKAVLTLDGGSQTFRFGGVTSDSPLRPSASASSTEIVLPNLSFNADEVYPMAVSGNYVDGQAFSYLVHVEIAQIP